jgi:hypothetical protein
VAYKKGETYLKHIVMYFLCFKIEKFYISDTRRSRSTVRGGAVGRGTELQARRSRVRFPVVSLEFFIDIILPAAL